MSSPESGSGVHFMGVLRAMKKATTPKVQATNAGYSFSTARRGVAQDFRCRFVSGTARQAATAEGAVQNAAQGRESSSELALLSCGSGARSTANLVMVNSRAPSSPARRGDTTQLRTIDQTPCLASPQSTPPGPRKAIPTPIVLPTIEWLVDTAIPRREAMFTHRELPTSAQSIASCVQGGRAGAGATRAGGAVTAKRQQHGDRGRCMELRSHNDTGNCGTAEDENQGRRAISVSGWPEKVESWMIEPLIVFVTPSPVRGFECVQPCFRRRRRLSKKKSQATRRRLSFCSCSHEDWSGGEKQSRAPSITAPRNSVKTAIVHAERSVREPEPTLVANCAGEKGELSDVSSRTVTFSTCLECCLVMQERGESSGAKHAKGKDACRVPSLRRRWTRCRRRQQRRK